MRRKKLTMAMVAVASLSAIGAEAQDVQATQTAYSEVSGANAVLVEWSDPTPEAGDLEVLRDGAVIGTVPSGDGRVAFAAVDEPAGNHTYALRRTGVSLGSQEQEVLTAQPFANPEAGESFLCAERAGDGSCDVVIDWVNGFPIPSYYEVYLDGALVDTIPGFSRTTEVLDISAGERCVTVLGFLRGPDQGYIGRFRGEPRETCCSVSCGAVGCLAPQDLALSQVEYGPGAASSALARWRLPAGPYDRGLVTLVDGVEGASLPGDARMTTFAQLPTGVRELGVIGRCGLPDGASGTARDRIQILEATPHPSPIAGDVTCSWAPEEWGTTTFRWTEATPSEWVAVYRVEAGQAVFLESAPGNPAGHSVHYTEAGEQFLVQFFTTADGYSYGSPRYTCGTAPAGNRFVRGICNGSDAELNISSPIFGLQYLFSGGSAPPCVVACDTNGDDRVDISDMVASLGYLFQGGPPPAGWVDSTGDRVPDPTCETASVEECAATNAAACPP